jgi:hypothetical protein
MYILGKIFFCKEILNRKRKGFNVTKSWDNIQANADYTMPNDDFLILLYAKLEIRY